MKAVAKTVTGDTITISGDTANALYAYFAQPTGERVSPGWVSAGNKSLNMNHVVTIEFIPEVNV